MNIKTILIMMGEPNSTFSEILLKFFVSKEFKVIKKKNNTNWISKFIFTANEKIKL